MELTKNQLFAQELSSSISIKSDNQKIDEKIVNIAFFEKNSNDKLDEPLIHRNSDGATTIKSKIEGGIDLTKYYDSNNKLFKESYFDKNTTINKLFSDDGELSSIIVNSSNPDDKTSQKITYNSLDDFLNQKPSEKILNDGLPNQIKINYTYEDNVIKEFRKYNDKTIQIETGIGEDGKSVKYKSLEIQNDKGKYNEFSQFDDDGKLQIKRCSTEEFSTGKKIVQENGYQKDGETLKYTSYSTTDKGKTSTERNEYQPDGKTLQSQTFTEAQKGKTTTEYKEYQHDGKTLKTESYTVEENGRINTHTKNYQSDGKTLASESIKTKENGITSENTKIYQADGKTLKSETTSVTKDGQTTTTVKKYKNDGKSVESETTTITKANEKENPNENIAVKGNDKKTNTEIISKDMDKTLNRLSDKFSNNPNRDLILDYLKKHLKNILPEKNIEAFISGVFNKIFTETKTTPQNITPEQLKKTFESFEKNISNSQKILNTNSAPVSAVLFDETNPTENILSDKKINQNSENLINETKTLSTQKEHVQKHSEDDIIKNTSEEIKNTQPEKQSSVKNPAINYKSATSKIIDNISKNPNIKPKTKDNILFYYNHTVAPYAEKYGINKSLLDIEFAEQLKIILPQLEAQNPETTVSNFEKSFNKHLAVSTHKNSVEKLFETYDKVDKVNDLTNILNDKLLQDVLDEIELDKKNSNYRVTTRNKTVFDINMDSVSAINAGKLPEEQIEKLIKLLAFYSNDSLKDKKLQELVGATLVANKYSSEKIEFDNINRSNEENLENKDFKI